MFGEPPVLDPVKECDLLHCTEEERQASEAELQAIPKFRTSRLAGQQIPVSRASPNNDP